MNMVRRAHASCEDADGNPAKADFKHLGFAIGWFLMSIVTALTDGLAILFAPLAILAPLSGFTVLINMVVAQRVNNETLTALDGAIVALIFPGILLAVIFGPHDSPTVDSTFITCHAKQTAWLVYEVLVWGLYIACFLLTKHVYTVTGPGSWEPNKEFAARHPLLASLRPLTRLIMAGIGGGHQMVCTKLFFGTLKTIGTDNNMFKCGGWTRVYPFLVALFLVFCTILQLTSLNKAISAEQALVAVPLYNVMFMGFTLLTSSVFDATFAHSTSSSLENGLFFAGVSFIGCGVLLILKRPDPEEASELLSTECNGGEGTDPRSSFMSDGDARERASSYSNAMFGRVSVHTPAALTRSMARTSLEETLVS